MQTYADIIRTMSAETNINETYIQNVLELLEQENTIAYIARYQKAKTNNMDEHLIKKIADRYAYLIKLEKRQTFIIETLQTKGLLTNELLTAIKSVNTLSELETLYEPYMTNRVTRAKKAIELGLQPLADLIMQNDFKTNVKQAAANFVNEQVPTVDVAIDKACDIIAAIIAQDPIGSQMALKSLWNYGYVQTKLAKKELDEEEKYHLYYDWKNKINFLKAYQIMAINRAVEAKVLSLKFLFDEDYIINFMANKYHKKRATDCAPYIAKAAKDGLKRLVFPAVINSVHKELTNKAQEQSIKVFSNNLKHLLLTKPVLPQTVLSIDPGFAHGCKIAVIDAFNNVLATQTIYPHAPFNKINEAEQIIATLLTEKQVRLIAIGNKTASTETLIWINEFLKKQNLSIPFVSVNEDGASAYSVNEIANEELNDCPVNIRSAISIARRVLDPLSELIKIDPQNIGVGQYQHDLDNKMLEEELNFCVSYCVNQVGVDINLSNKYLLAKISGLNKRAASSIMKYLQTNKTIKSREEIKNIPYVTSQVYLQAIGFLRVHNSAEILDSTIIHPDDYLLAKQLMQKLNIKPEDVIAQKVKINLNDALYNQLSQEFSTSHWTIKYILEALSNPTYDIRDNYGSLMFWNQLKNFYDLQINQTYDGIITNVTDFGLFIDIGLPKTVFAPNKLITKDGDLSINMKIKVKIDKININKEQVVVMVI
ncbi:helix-hairpin-helix domain-containing protein [Ureaplasma miroungigenitalium]|uniref:Tex-like N-terminal domain-containing protein n=1 Tax=Ureaplasma miroungigenitalium TaxID=1042321 RepID=UPI0021E96511|nr:Tex-like N-terminal domain-containing protein [Ureaplasma miroungigenitalium]MCV3734502.1 helix-hairpin-helix domain-containing protein [Ureaplasma miroungigenitalium]